MNESLLLTGCWTPCRRYRQALVPAVEESQHVAAENVTDVLHPTDTGTIWLYRPMRHVKRRVHHRQVVFFRRVLKRERREFFFLNSHELSFEILLFYLTKYRSVATDTRMRSSPTRTFSPSDLCLEAGCTVHQHASPLRKETLRNSKNECARFHSCFSNREKFTSFTCNLKSQFYLNSVKSYNCV